MDSLILGIVTLVSTIRAFCFGVWTIKQKNTTGGMAVIFMSLTAFSLIAMYLATELT